jgi:hypothetical protein
MENEEFDLSKMAVEDLFGAKDERRKRLASLPFEEKIAIVKKLQGVSRAIHFKRNVNDDKPAAGEEKKGIKTTE